MDDPRNLTDLLPDTALVDKGETLPIQTANQTVNAGPRVQRAASQVSNQQRTKITPEVIAEDQINKIKENKIKENTEFADHLKDSLRYQEEYDLAIDNNELEKVGAGEYKEIKKFEEKPLINDQASEEIVDEPEDTYKPVDLSLFTVDIDEDELDVDVNENVTDDTVEPVTDDLSDLRDSLVATIDDADKCKYTDIIVKKTPSNKIVPRNNKGAMNDVAFVNSINKMKKSIFSSTSIPLVNSGFIVDVQGSGIVDMLQMYKDRVADAPFIEYTLDRLRIFIRSIKSVNPYISPAMIAHSIHENDYELLALAHVSSTMKNFVIPNICSHCSSKFKIEASPIDTIMNIDAINEKAAAIRSASSVDEISILGTDVVYETEFGMKITIGHPSIIDRINRLDAALRVTSRDDKEGKKFSENMAMVKMCRLVELPDGQKTVNPYQIYKALSLLDETHLKEVDSIISKKNEELIVPIFGINTVKCPICGKPNTNINIGDIDDMVFYHIMVTQY